MLVCNMNISYTKDLSEILSDDTKYVGGKAAALGGLIKQGFNIPHGFVILTNAFDDFIEKHNLVPEIHAALEHINYDDICIVESASQRIQDLIMSLPIQPDLEKEIKKFADSMKVTGFAVRSSATSEDGTEHTWAGQLETFLNIKNENLIENIKKCWASLFSPRALMYKFRNMPKSEYVSIAVIIQEIILSDISGISFSVHPVTENYDQLVIEAAYGLGESVVSGEVTPNSYIVDKTSDEIIDKNIFPISRKIIANPDGGIMWKELSESEKNLQILNDEEILFLTKIIKQIEKKLGFPVDVEWTKKDSVFFVLQARPITTLSNNTNL